MKQRFIYFGYFREIAEKVSIAIHIYAITVYDINFGIRLENPGHRIKGAGNVVVIRTQPRHDIPGCLIPSFLNGCRLSLIGAMPAVMQRPRIMIEYFLNAAIRGCVHYRKLMTTALMLASAVEIKPAWPSTGIAMLKSIVVRLVGASRAADLPVKSFVKVKYRVTVRFHQFITLRCLDVFTHHLRYQFGESDFWGPP
jgi:hypothetical protein